MRLDCTLFIPNWDTTELKILCLIVEVGTKAHTTFLQPTTFLLYIKNKCVKFGPIFEFCIGKRYYRIQPVKNLHEFVYCSLNKSSLVLMLCLSSCFGAQEFKVSLESMRRSMYQCKNLVVEK